MAEKGFRLKLSGDGINVDRAVSAEVAQQIVAIALGTAPSVGQELGKQVAASVAQGLAAQAARAAVAHQSGSFCFSKRLSGFLSRSRLLPCF